MLALCLAVAASLSGDPAFEEGLKLYKELEYEQAIIRFEEVAVRPALPPADKATALLWLGLSYAGTGDLESAKRDLRAALVADDALQLPPSTPPRIATLFEELRADVQKEKAAQAAKAPPPQNPPPPAPAPSNADAHFPYVVGGGAAAGVGALALVAGGVFTWAAFDQFSKAQDKNQFQDDAKRELDYANTAGIAAAVLLPAAVVLVGGGGTLLALNLE